jgi:hypothetical protein
VCVCAHARASVCAFDSMVHNCVYSIYEPLSQITLSNHEVKGLFMCTPHLFNVRNMLCLFSLIFSNRHRPTAVEWRLFTECRSCGWSMWHYSHIIKQLTPLSSDLLQKLIVAQVAKKLAAIYGTKSSWPCWEEPTAGPHPEPLEIRSHVRTIFQ